MVAGERHRHRVARDDLAVARPTAPRRERADRQDRRLRRVDDRGEAVTPNMPRLETVNVPPPSSGGVIVPSRTRSASARVSRAISPSDFGRRRRPSARPARSSARAPRARRSPASAAAAAVAVAAVGARVLAQRERAGLDDHVVVSWRAPARASCLSSPRSATHASMSISICSANSGIVAFDSAIRRAIVCCVRVSSTIVVSPFAVATPRAGCRGAGGASGACAAAPRLRCCAAAARRLRRAASVRPLLWPHVGLHDPSSRPAAGHAVRSTPRSLRSVARPGTP